MRDCCTLCCIHIRSSLHFSLRPKNSFPIAFLRAEAVAESFPLSLRSPDCTFFHNWSAVSLRSSRLRDMSTVSLLPDIFPSRASSHSASLMRQFVFCRESSIVMMQCAALLASAFDAPNNTKGQEGLICKSQDSLGAHFMTSCTCWLHSLLNSLRSTPHALRSAHASSYFASILFIFHDHQRPSSFKFSLLRCTKW